MKVDMRGRWHDWVIVLALTVIGVGGVLAIWGDDLWRLVVDVAREAPREPDAPAPSPPTPGGAAGTAI